MKKKRITIIGAGYAGLSLSALLAKDGHEVTVVEKLDQIGGRARMWETEGYKFDMGPSWYMMPEVFDQFFAHFDKKPSDYYTLERLNPQYRLFFAEDETIDISSDLDQNIALFESIEPGSGEKFKEFLAKAQHLYDTSMKYFIYRSYDSYKELLDPQFRESGMTFELIQNLDKLLKKYFKSEKLRKILSYTVVFLGGNPKNTPGMYALMSHVDFNLGVWYPKGGMNAVARGIAQVAKEQGVEFKLGTEVKEIIVENGTTKGVETRAGFIEADIVVNSGDYHYGETQLLKSEYQSYPEKYWKKRTMAPSAFILYLGLSKKLKGLSHHNLFLANDWQNHFDEIFDHPKWPDHPSYYICNPVTVDPQMAPEGKDNLFALVPVASGLEDSDQLRKDYAEKILKDLEGQLKEDIRPHIEVQRIFSQRDFSSDYFSYKGTALGLAHTLTQSAMFRPKHRSKKVKNLYYTGQYVHPGIGVPMVMIASEVVYGLIKNESE